MGLWGILAPHSSTDAGPHAGQAHGMVGLVCQSRAELQARLPGPPLPVPTHSPSFQPRLGPSSGTHLPCG